MGGCKECQHLGWDLTLGRPICRVVNAEINTWTYGDNCIKFAPKPDLSEIVKPSDNIISQIGLPAALEQLAEECCELGQAALKLARFLRGENPTRSNEYEIQESLKEEFADVSLCMELIQKTGIIGSQGTIDRIVDEKYARWMNSLKEAKE